MFSRRYQVKLHIYGVNAGSFKEVSEAASAVLLLALLVGVCEVWPLIRMHALCHMHSTAHCQAIQGEQQHDVTVTCGLAAEKLCHSVLPQYLTTVPCHSALSQCLITGSYHSVLSQRVINLSYHSPLSQCLITVPYHSRLLPCVLPSANVWSP